MSEAEILRYIWKIILATCAGITVILTAAGKIYSVIVKAKAPSTKLKNQVEDHEKRLNDHDTYLKQDKTAIDIINEGNRVTQKAILAIMEFQISGRSTDSLVNAKKDLNEYLINK